MPVIHSADIAVHQVHGSTFSSFVAPSRGSTQLCAWQLRVFAGLTGESTGPPEDEVLLLLDGELTVSLDGTATDLAAGDVVLVPAGQRVARGRRDFRCHSLGDNHARSRGGHGRRQPDRAPVGQLSPGRIPPRHLH